MCKQQKPACSSNQEIERDKWIALEQLTGAQDQLADGNGYRGVGHVSARSLMRLAICSPARSSAEWPQDSAA